MCNKNLILVFQKQVELHNWEGEEEYKSKNLQMQRQTKLFLQSGTRWWLQN
jgi:hypothetical protein